MHSLLGTWRLRFGVDVPWHEHQLEIVSVEGNDVRAYLTLDWRGDGRDPDQRKHEVAVRASLDERLGLRFSVVVGALLPRRYRFELFLVDRELVGFADVALERETAVTERLGVKLARG